MTATPILVFAHAGVAALVTIGAGLSVPARQRLIRSACALGIISAAALYAFGDRWRTTDLSLPEGRLAAVAVGAAWLLVLVGERERGDWFTAACVGAASSGLLMSAGNRWVVPLLLFSACSTTALLLVLRSAEPASPARFAIAAGDALVVCGLAGAAVDAGSWVRPDRLSGWTTWAVAAGLLLRTGAIPMAGAWGALGTAAAPALPLLVAGGFAIPAASLGVQPWLAVTLLAASLVITAWTLLHREFRIGLVAAWPVVLGLGVALASTRAGASAGVQASLACAAIALWPLTLGRGQAERGLLLAFLPLTAGSAGVVLAASGAFAAASRVSGILDFLPWALVVGLLALALLAGVLLGARVGAAGEPEDFEPSAVLALWGLLGSATLLWLVAPQGIGRAAADGSTLQLGAVVGAVAAGWLGRKRPLPTDAELLPVVRFRRTMLEPRPEVARLVSAAGSAAWVAMTAMVLWFTYEGLRLAFL